MSKSAIVDNSLSLGSIIAQRVREKRLDRPGMWSVQISFDGIPVEVRNISDTGMAFVCTRNFDISKEGILLMQLSDNRKIEMRGRIIWNRTEGDRTIYGMHFNNHYLPEGILEALDQVTAIREELSQSTAAFNNLDPEFKRLTFEIGIFLGNTKRELGKLEDTITVYSEGIRNSYREVVSSTLEPAFVSQLKDYSRKIDAIFSKVHDKKLRKIHAEFFRSQLGDYYTQNPFIGRALRKPRGYAGDYEMMNQIYRDKSEGRTFFEMMMHRYGISESSSLSVQYRRNYFVNKIFKLSEGRSKFKIASLACGPAKEVIDFLQQVPVNEADRFEFFLLDQDIEALLNAKRNIFDQILKRDLQCTVHFLPISVKMILELTPETRALSDVGFDFIYTAGLYDYLTQPVAKLLTRNALRWIKPGGDLIIGNFHPYNPTKSISELVADWKLIHRNEDEMTDLIHGESITSFNLHKDNEGIDLFLEVKK
jgi:extracellular factor (EF) 3-hydroxypalmitic acid methyl ester biosynthesis protein